MLIGETERQHFGHEFANLSRGKVDDGRNQSPDEAVWRVMLGNLRRRPLDADRGAEIDGQLERRFARIWEWIDRDYAPDADVDGEKLVKGDSGGRGCGGIVIEVHRSTLYFNTIL